MELQVWNHRGSLANTMRAIEEGELTIGFIGGSITDARPRHNWPEPVIAWFVDMYPGVRVVVENAAIGATGSDLAVFRAKRDLIDRGCDIVFVDYAVNDNDVPTERRMRTREGLLRQLLENGTRDVVLVHTFSQDMAQPMLTGEQPASVAELEVLAEHYGVGSVWMGLYALRQVQRGLMRWEEWLPDNLHPTSRGSLAYGESVIHYLRQELASDKVSVKPTVVRQLVKPMNPLHWGAAVTLPLKEVRTTGPWTIRRWPYYEWVDQVLDTAAPGAGLTIPFVGRGIALGVDFGKATAEIRYRLDGGDWQIYEADRPDWNGNDGWLRLFTISDELAAGSHQLELETFLGNSTNNKGTNLRLAIIGIIH